jgi:hypothetical protein
LHFLLQDHYHRQLTRKEGSRQANIYTGSYNYYFDTR